MLGMGQVISLADRRGAAGATSVRPEDVEWSGGDPSGAEMAWTEDAPFPLAGSERFDDRRAQGELEAAFARLESAVESEGRALDRQDETELLAVIGELALGCVPEAARRLERLRGRVMRRRPVGRTVGG
jgi:hypothetical protein